MQNAVNNQSIQCSKQFYLTVASGWRAERMEPCHHRWTQMDTDVPAVVLSSFIARGAGVRGDVRISVYLC